MKKKRAKERIGGVKFDEIMHDGNGHRPAFGVVSSAFHAKQGLFANATTNVIPVQNSKVGAKMTWFDGFFDGATDILGLEIREKVPKRPAQPVKKFDLYYNNVRTAQND